MPLFEVEVSFIMIVEAETQSEAEKIAAENSSDAFDSHTADFWASTITQKASIPGDWKDSIPYGCEDELTCLEHFEE